MTITSTALNVTHTFEVVEKIPTDFFVWCIGENMGHDDYIPLCEVLHPEDKEDCTVNTSTLKAIKLPVEEVKLLRESAIVGVNDLQAATKALHSKRRGYWPDRKREQAKKTIEIFKRITL